MRVKTIFLILLLTASVALARKVQAPVTFHGSTQATQAQLSVTFVQPATAVEIKVWGTGALTDQLRPNVTRMSTVTAGQKVPVNVSYTSPNGPASVAISVTALYGDQKMVKVGNFLVGEAPQSQKPAVDSNGEKVIVLPAEVVE